VEVIDFFDTIWPPAEPGEVSEGRFISRDKSVICRTYRSAPEFLAEAARHARTRNIYHGANLRHGGGKSENVKRVATFYGDIDFKLFADQPDPESAAIHAVFSFPCPPTAMVWTGGGLQPYFGLREVFEIGDDDENRARFEIVNSALARAICGPGRTPDAVYDLARVLRTPGSWNYKYSPPRPTFLAWLDPDCRYAFGDIEEVLRDRYSWALAEAERARIKARDAGDAGDAGSPIVSKSPPELLRLAASGPIRRDTLALLESTGAAGRKSASEADAAIAAGLVHAGPHRRRGARADPRQRPGSGRGPEKGRALRRSILARDSRKRRQLRGAGIAAAERPARAQGRRCGATADPIEPGSEVVANALIPLNPARALPLPPLEFAALSAVRTDTNIYTLIECRNGRPVDSRGLTITDPNERQNYAAAIEAMTGVQAGPVDLLLMDLILEIEDGLRKAESAAGRPSQGTRHVALALDAGAELFHDRDGIAYATIPVGNHRENWPLRSTGFRRWLQRTYYVDTQSAANSQAVQDAIGALEGKALFDGPEVPAHTRVAEHHGTIYLDLADAAWRAVEITAAGWRVVDAPPVKFRRTRGMLALPDPMRGGQLADLRKFVNVEADEDWLQLEAWLVASIFPRGPYPICCFRGGQGSAKSTQSRVLRALVDPNSAPLRAVPREIRDLMIAANNGWIVASDNLCNLPE
jgi:hypothetical protein